MQMKFLDLFAGIGGFRLGMEMAGHECVGYVEIDKFARKSYEAMYDTKGEWTAHDITKVPDDDIRHFRGQVDVICAGFPCQAFSIAGKRKGFEDTRGTLFFEIARFANIIRPRYLFLENVKGLLNHDNGNTFETILRVLDELGYDAEWDVLNSKDFGVPQNRERVFIIGHLRGASTRKVFPITGESSEIDCNVVGKLALPGKDQWNRVYSTDGLSPTLTTMQGGRQEPKIIDDQGRRNKKLKLLDICPTLRRETHGNEQKVVQAVLTPDREEKRQNGRRMKEPGEPMFTLTAQDRHGVSDGYRIRKLTPKECWRLQGFPDELFEKAAKVNSDSQLYKQAGNSVTVNVIYEIAKKL